MTTATLATMGGGGSLGRVRRSAPPSVDQCGGGTVALGVLPTPVPAPPPPLLPEEEPGFRMGMVTTRWLGGATAMGNGDRLNTLLLRPLVEIQFLRALKCITLTTVIGMPSVAYTRKAMIKGASGGSVEPWAPPPGLSFGRDTDWWALMAVLMVEYYDLRTVNIINTVIGGDDLGDPCHYGWRWLPQVSSRPPVPPCLPPPLPLEEEHGFRMGMVTTRWPGAATATGNGDRERDRESEDEGDAPPSLSMATDLALVPSPARGRREECEGTRAFWLIVVDFVASGSEGTTTETAEQQLSERGA
uniref:Uncharacterized protein n=1 Tax=Oryza sativa subsp. japonica TaxID=39947 RepID=Q2QTU2_ORYSJ|nr:hypothetical protein LOC_Os12g18510 [Oryza sativa Japonica Group]